MDQLGLMSHLSNVTQFRLALQDLTRSGNYTIKLQAFQVLRSRMG